MLIRRAAATVNLHRGFRRTTVSASAGSYEIMDAPPSRMPPNRLFGLVLAAQACVLQVGPAHATPVRFVSPPLARRRRDSRAGTARGGWEHLQGECAQRLSVADVRPEHLRRCRGARVARAGARHGVVLARLH